ncbi:hypothetical protein ABMX48_06595 [Streptomyces cavourensis]
MEDPGFRAEGRGHPGRERAEGAQEFGVVDLDRAEGLALGEVDAGVDVPGGPPGAQLLAGPQAVDVEDRVGAELLDQAGFRGDVRSSGRSASESRRTTPRLAVPRRGLTTTGQPWCSAKARTAASSGASAKAGAGIPAPSVTRFMVSLSRKRASAPEVWPAQPSRSRTRAAVSRSPSLRATTRSGTPKWVRSSVTARQTASRSSVAGTVRAAAAPPGTESRASSVVT